MPEYHFAQTLGWPSYIALIAVTVAMLLGLYLVWSRFTVRGNIHRLSSDKWWVRARAAKALGRPAAHQAVPRLIEVLRRDPLNSNVQEPVAWALGEIGDPQAIEQLREKLDKPYSRDLQFNCVEALVKLDPEKRIQPWLEMLSSPNYHIRQASAIALRLIGNKQSIEPLVEFVSSRSGKHTVDVTEVVLTLRTLGATKKQLSRVLQDRYGCGLSVEELALLGGEEAIEQLVAQLNSGSRGKRLHAAISLAEVGDARGFSVLVDIFNVRYTGRPRKGGVSISSFPDRLNERLRALSALARLGDARAVPILRSRLTDYDFTEVQEATRQALSRLEQSRPSP